MDFFTLLLPVDKLDLLSWKILQERKKWPPLTFFQKNAIFLGGLYSEKVDVIFNVLQATPWSLTLYGLRQVWYNASAVTGDRATHQCEPPAVAVPYGMGLVSCLMPTRYDYAGCYNAINSSLTRGCS